MKNFLNTKSLPLVVFLLGSVTGVQRKLLYFFGTDEKGLLIPNHPQAVVVAVLTLAALAYIILSVWKLDGSKEYGDNFKASKAAMAGHAAAAAGILITILTKDPIMPGYLGGIWKVLGYIAPVCLVLAGLARFQGKRPFFLLHLLPCLFFVFHIVNHYQMWSGNPQFQDYVFTLFGTMALMFFTFYSTAFDVGSGQRRMHLGMGLTAVYLCMAELAVTRYPWLYLGGILWVLTNLCTLTPVPKSEPKPESKEEK